MHKKTAETERARRTNHVVIVGSTATTFKSAILDKTTWDVGDYRKGLAGLMTIGHEAQTGDPVGNITQGTVVKTEAAAPLRTVDEMNGNIDSSPTTTAVTERENTDLRLTTATIRPEMTTDHNTDPRTDRNTNPSTDRTTDRTQDKNTMIAGYIFKKTRNPCQLRPRR